VKPRNRYLWYLLQGKRLLKKPSFVVLLVLLLFLVWGLRAMEAEESGMLRIALCAEDPHDELALAIVGELQARQSVLGFASAGSIEEAYALVRANKADAAWVFRSGLQARIDAFTAYGSRREPYVLIVEREDNIFLQLAREALYAALWRESAYSLYRGFVLQKIAGAATEAELAWYFNENMPDGDWFKRAYLDNEPQAVSYLTAPLRGILSLFVALCGLASCLYYNQDKKRGLYVPFSPCYHLPALTLGGLGALLALALTGYFTVWYREVLLMVLLILAVAGFVDVLRALLRKSENLAVAIPLVVLLMLVLCPVFLTVRVGFLPLGWLLPPFYYLNALHNQTFVYYLGGYVLVLWAVRGSYSSLISSLNPSKSR
jgi:ABC-2 type transport system permease protein